MAHGTRFAEGCICIIKVHCLTHFHLNYAAFIWKEYRMCWKAVLFHDSSFFTRRDGFLSLVNILEGYHEKKNQKTGALGANTSVCVQ